MVRIGTIGLLAGLLPGIAAAADIAGTRAAIGRSLDAQYSHIDALYKDIHAHPELGFQEARTAAKLAAEMKALGFEVTEGVGKTGIVALYRNGPGPTVMVRTELDALPLEEKTGLPYASKAKQMLRGVETPVMHACGHDIHMAAWVAVARTMLDLKDQWSGTLMFVGQPAEEGGGGAKAMVADGLFTRFPKPDYGFALHVGPGPYGYRQLQAGRHQLHRRQLSSHLHRQGRPRLAAAHDHRSGDDGRPLHRRRAERDQPREGLRAGSASSRSARCRRAMPATSSPTPRPCAARSAPGTTTRGSRCWPASSAPPRRWR